jgi:hypothetical protein
LRALGVETLLPVFAAGTWHSGPAGYGLLRMAPGIAAVLAGLELSMLIARASRRPASPSAAATPAPAARTALKSQLSERRPPDCPRRTN